MSSLQISTTAIVLISQVLRSNAYDCDGAICICSDESCHTNCTDGFCQNKHFICGKDVDSCSFDCHDDESCSDSNFYMASNTFHIDCVGRNSCDNTTIRCGVEDDLQNGMETCTITASESSMNNSYIL